MSAITLRAPATALVAGHADDSRCVERVCPLCGRDNHAQTPLPISRGSWRLKSCQTCAFVYLENVLRYEELSVNHCWSMSRLAEKQFRRAAGAWREPAGKPLRAVRKWVRSLLPRRKVARLADRYMASGHVLEVGCGNGQMLKQLGERFTPCGIEIDARAAAKAREFIEPRGGVLLHADGYGGLKALPNSSMTGVLMHSYLEHENQPLEVLRRTAHVLVPSGVLVIKVPNFACLSRQMLGSAWPGFRFPDHVNYFTPASLQSCVAAAGLKVIRCGWLDRLPTSDNMWLVARAAESR
jgi:SAM-dependent methyltransferase